MKIKLNLILLIFILKFYNATAISDSLKTNKNYFQTSIYSGLSFGENENSYRFGGRFGSGLGFHYHRNKTFSGIEIYKSSFKDKDDPNFRVGNWIKYKATQKVHIFLASVGQEFGNRQNICISGGLGLLRYKYPIIKFNDGFFLRHYYVDSYDIKNSLCLNSSMKIYLPKKKYQMFGITNVYVSNQISFFSVSMGIEYKFNFKSTKNALFDIY